MPTEYTTKKRARQYRKNGNEVIEYWLQSEDGFIKTVSPMQFHKSQLPDVTTPETLEWAAANAIGGLQFNRRVEAMQMMRDKGLPRHEVCKAFSLVV
jgi:hypothetical protein